MQQYPDTGLPQAGQGMQSVQTANADQNLQTRQGPQAAEAAGAKQNLQTPQAAEAASTCGGAPPR